MVGKAFSVTIDLDVHAVSCPGVWLCPAGKVSLQIYIFDLCTSTHRLASTFPLLYHDKFAFKKVFVGVATLAELERKLSEECISMELIQWSPTANGNVCLAAFETNLAELLYPEPCSKGLLAGVDVDLLMKPTSLFPGILSPKIEVSTRTTIEEVPSFGANKEAHVINPKTINSKNHSCANERGSQPSSEVLRQKKVCHIGQEKVNSYVCRLCRRNRDKGTISSQSRDPANNSHSMAKCYLSSNLQSQCCKNPTNASPRSDDNYTISNDGHILESCPICLKYKCYFNDRKPRAETESGTNAVVRAGRDARGSARNGNCQREFGSSDAATATSHDNCRTLRSLRSEDEAKRNGDCKRGSECSHRKYCTTKVCRAHSVCRSSSVPALKEDPTLSILLAKKKQLEKTKESLNYAKCPTRDSCCSLSSDVCQNNEVRKGFYKNLEKFYKRMYKHAKQRVHDLDEN